MGNRPSKRKSSSSHNLSKSELATGVSTPSFSLNGCSLVAETPKPDPNKKIFGVPLEIAAQRSDEKGLVPAPVRQCIEFLERKGLRNVGVYRISGSTKRILQIISQYNTGERVILSEDEDVHNVVGVLKAFLRELPDPIFTNAARMEFRNAGDILEDNSRVMAIRTIIGNLPQCNRETLRLLMTHLSRVASFSEENKMTPNNLSFSVCPELGSVFTTMIQHSELIFSKRSLSAQLTPDSDVPYITVSESTEQSVSGYITTSTSTSASSSSSNSSVSSGSSLKGTSSGPLRTRGATVVGGGRF